MSANSFYYLVFGVLAAVTVYLEVQKGKNETVVATSEAYRTFRNNYVVVYALMMGWSRRAPGPSANCRSVAL